MRLEGGRESGAVTHTHTSVAYSMVVLVGSTLPLTLTPSTPRSFSWYVTTLTRHSSTGHEVVISAAPAPRITPVILCILLGILHRRHVV